MSTDEKKWDVIALVSDGNGSLQYRIDGSRGDAFMDVPSNGTIKVRDSSRLEIIAIPNAGHQWLSWSDGTVNAFIFTKDEVNSQISITAAFSERTHPVTFRGDANVTSDLTDGTETSEGEDAVVMIDITTGYEFSFFEVRVNGIPLTTDGYRYNEDTGELTIYGEYITGPVSITATSMIKTYSVRVRRDERLDRLRRDMRVNHGEEVVIKIYVQTGYLLPSSVNVTVGGELLTGEYTYYRGGVISGYLPGL